MFRTSIYLLAFLAAACAPDQEAASGSIAINENASQTENAADTAAAAIEARRESLIAFRRDIHRNPELANEEQRTASKAAGRLRELGFDVTENIGGYGVIGVLHGARPGPVVAFRADMDAVRSDAPDPAPFASERTGIRHICGHDIHTTIGLALAEGFAASRDSLSGSVMLVFQPAEETTNGARDMLADGAFDELRPDAIFAYHTAPPETGVLVTANARLMAAPMPRVPPVTIAVRVIPSPEIRHGSSAICVRACSRPH
jgi:metal-dependent amidase/aminoacylase/carboxypeptidase family protein